MSKKLTWNSDFKMRGWPTIRISVGGTESGCIGGAMARPRHDLSAKGTFFVTV